MFTAADAYEDQSKDLDNQIRLSVKNRNNGNSALLRVWGDDWFASTIKEELEKRGFKNISGEGGVYKWDVYFEW